MLVIRILTIICLAFLSGCSTTKAPSIVGRSFPYTRVTLADGTMKIFDEYHGRNVAIIFWATWCGKSQRALRRFNNFAATYPPNQAVFLAVNIDKQVDSGKVQEHIREDKLRSVMHAYSGNDVEDEAFIRFEGEELPYLVVMNREGRVAVQTGDDDDVYDYLKPSRKR